MMVFVELVVEILRSFGVGGFVVFFGIWTVLAQVDFSQSIGKFLIIGNSCSKAWWSSCGVTPRHK